MYIRSDRQYVLRPVPIRVRIVFFGCGRACKSGVAATAVFVAFSVREKVIAAQKENRRKDSSGRKQSWKVASAEA